MDEEEKKNNIGTPKHNSLINSTGKHTSVTHNGAKHNSPMIINNGVIISHNDYGSIVTGRRSPKDYINGRMDLSSQNIVPGTSGELSSLMIGADQRQPLLHPTISSSSNEMMMLKSNEEVDDIDGSGNRELLISAGCIGKGAYEYLVHHSDQGNDMAIEMPTSYNKKIPSTISSSSTTIEITNTTSPIVVRTEPRFPKEKWKTFIAFIVLVINFIITTVSLALVHERVPDRQTYGPLPDIILDGFSSLDWALDVSEVLIMLSTNMCIVLIFFHKHRFIVMRRVFLIMSILYLLRSLTMFVTVLPVPSKTYYCSPKVNNSSPFLVTKRVVQLLSGFGLSINGKHTFCGDYIYSGHTVMLVLACLVIREYSPKKLWVIHYLSWLISTMGVIMVLLAHGHYTIDVLIAYYVTTRIFYIYHTMANNSVLKHKSTNNYLSRVFWFKLFRYFEKNIGGVVPKQYDWPLPWPRKFLSRKYPNRDS
ncbi:phosphatidylcholine:ceramide cholinephosphotransferase 2-like [Ctenocephalides felis]|uniref:phosphatidylcholine:ceramide cholinephosphotransferase 2-like n=1 Tax=Ctenocephalides felis TaxID=7515 RepID=UPI000E6E59F6|nr:phosphatidylcholine:ceramide cholinephosphotransferase 2-like [Ctenocephalides felis]XP_026473115.1 phosphatidylcholine:ceramide cholinephosphotransferase 2-like [Ctenocephalides felis]